MPIGPGGGVLERAAASDGDGAGRQQPAGEAPWFRRRPSRRSVRLLLGAIWLADGILQLQPSMFSRSFALGTLAGSAHGQPAWVAGGVAAMARFLAPHIAAWNVLFALTQLAIGACLVLNRAVRPALVASIGWSFSVWWFGEAFGGLFSGSASILTGAPGAVMLYGLLALLVWPRQEAADGAAHEGDRSGRSATRGRLVWAALWVGGALFQLLPSNRPDGAISAAISGAAAGEPRVFAALGDATARLVGTHGAAVGIVLAVTEAAVGIGALRRRPDAALAVGALLSLGFWVVGQDLGGILTGTGTDPNTGPLFVLLAVALWQGAPPVATGRQDLAREDRMPVMSRPPRARQRATVAGSLGSRPT